MNHCKEIRILKIDTVLSRAMSEDFFRYEILKNNPKMFFHSDDKNILITNETTARIRKIVRSNPISGERYEWSVVPIGEECIALFEYLESTEKKLSECRNLLELSRFDLHAIEDSNKMLNNRIDNFKKANIFKRIIMAIKGVI